MNLPVLICCFNRPEKTKEVFEAVKKYAPPRLYVSCDGPRSGSLDLQRVSDVHSLFDSKNQGFKILKNFSKENLGCAKAVAEGIKWFFENESQGIVLEDDTLPEPEFFDFCEYHLERHRHNSEIQGVSGNFLLPAELRKYHPEPAALTRYFFCWGWASWADRMAKFSLSANMWCENEFSTCQETLKVGNFEKQFWKTRFQMAYQNRYPGWAIKMIHQSWVSKRKWIVPNKDLVVNIGFGEDSTHTKGNRDFFLIKDSLFTNQLRKQLSDPIQDEVQELLRFQYFFNQEWAGVGNTLAELEIHDRLIQLKQKLFEMENLIASPIRLIKYILKSKIYRKWRP